VALDNVLDVQAIYRPVRGSRTGVWFTLGKMQNSFVACTCLVNNGLFSTTLHQLLRGGKPGLLQNYGLLVVGKNSYRMFFNDMRYRGIAFCGCDSLS
jgi:hypothetical protein